MEKCKEQTLIISYLLSFIFCGAIVGETVSLSIIVSTLGPTSLSKLYLINGFILFFLPLLFFRYVDSVSREKLLEAELLAVSAILIIMLIVNMILKNEQINMLILSGLYPVSYLSKTMLFLTFWTLANDIFPTNEAKKAFPVISAWGFIGGIVGAVGAKIILDVVKADTVICLWIASYLTACFFVRRIKNNFESRLLSREDLNVEKQKKIFVNTLDKVTKRFVKLITTFYFFVFLVVFSLDFLFWRVCHDRYVTSESIASFQFAFYWFHAIVTILGLKFALPAVIEKHGFSRILYCLPIVFVIGAVVLLTGKMLFPARVLWLAFIVVQFFRYVFFENAFSPIFQMLFTVIEKEKRGRVKTILDGIVKPAAIIMSGLLIILFENNVYLILGMILLSGIVMVVVNYYIRQWYTKALIPESKNYLHYNDLITELGKYKGEELYSLIQKYENSEDPDMRAVAIKLLARLESGQALDGLMRIYERENDIRLKEMIARSLSNHYGYKTNAIIEMLLKEGNPRIRANSIYSLNRMNCTWKRQLKPAIRMLLYENSIRVQIEASIFLWQNGDPHDRENVKDYLRNLLESVNSDRRSAGLYLLGSLKLPGWEKVLVDNLASASIQLFKKSIDVLMNQASLSIRIEALNKVGAMSRTHIAITGNIIKTAGSRLWETLIECFPCVNSRRMAFELIALLRSMADEIRASGKPLKIKKETQIVIEKWLIKELEMAYMDGFVLYHLRKNVVSSKLFVLDDAIRENYIRLCEWVIVGMVLLDEKQVMKWNYKEIDIRDSVQRFRLIEIIESLSSQKIGSLLLPLLKMQSWEIISKNGMNLFNFGEKNVESNIKHFMLSDNRWIRLCSLYTLSKYMRKNIREKEIMATLKVLSDDTNALVSSMATDILEQDESVQKRSRAFEMLELVLFFKHVPLFQSVNAENLLKLAEIAQCVHYAKEKLISSEGDISDNLYIVKKGSLRIVKGTGSEAKDVAVIGSGATYGELGLFTNAVRSASAITEEDCELYVIRRAEFKKLILKIPEITVNLLEVVSERLRVSVKDLSEFKRTIFGSSESECEQAF